MRVQGEGVGPHRLYRLAVGLRRTGSRERSPVGRRRVYARALYFWYYLALGSLYPFLNLYYQRVGLSGPQIGILVAVPALLGPVSGSLWSSVADRLGFHRRLLTLALAGTLVAGFSFSLTTRFAPLLLIATMYALFGSPISPLMDSAALEAASQEGTDYGRLRVWGTLGWIASTWMLGRLVDEGIRRLFYAFAALMAVTAGVSLLQPPRRQWRWEQPAWQGVRQLLGCPAVLRFLCSAFLLSVANGGGNQFLSIYMADIGASGRLIGVAWAISALSEVPMMFLAGRLLRKVGIRRFLLLGYLLYAARWLWLSANTVPAWVLPVQLLQGVSFTAFLVGGVTLMGDLAPRGLGATAQAVFTGTTFGLGLSVGSTLAGYLYEVAGLAWLYLVEGLLALAAAIILQAPWGERGRAGEQ